MISRIVDKIGEEIDKGFEKKCETCEEYAMCEMTGSVQPTACKHWKPDFEEFQRKWQEIKQYHS